MIVRRYLVLKLDLAVAVQGDLEVIRSAIISGGGRLPAVERLLPSEALLRGAVDAAVVGHV